MAPITQRRLRCSIIIVGYNSAADLSACLETLLAHPMQPDMGLAGSDIATEIIVVDNASHDETSAILSQWDGAITVLSLPENRGFAGGNNAGAALATGDILVFLNPDTVPRAGWLSALVEPLRDRRVGMTTAQLVLADRPHLVNACGNDITWTGLTVCRGLEQPLAAWSHPDEVAAVSGAAFAVRRELFERLGGFDEEYFLYYEDTDLSLRARLAGYSVRYVPQSVVAHRYRFKFSAQKAYYQERNRWLTLLGTLRPGTLLLLLPALLLGEAMAWTYAALHGPAHLRAKLRGWRWLWRHRAIIARKRRHAARLRRVPDRALLRHWSARLRFTGAVAAAPARMLEALTNGMLHLYGALCRGMLAW